MFDCKSPEGKEYVCYSKEECDGYFSGYGAVVVSRIYDQRYKGWYPDVDMHVIPVNVFADYGKGWYYIGKIEAKQAGENKIFMKFWLNIYDLDCNLLHSGYREGSINQAKPMKKENRYEQNSFELKATGY